MILQRLVSGIVLRPSRHGIPSGKDELLLEGLDGTVQVWRERTAQQADACLPPQAFFLRFLGSRGRAEMATLDPADRLDDVPAEVWTVNPPSFGRTSGPPDLARYAAVARESLAALLRHAEGRSVWVCGKSIGTAAALHAVAHCGAEGVMLRNVVPLQQLLRARSAWRSAGLARVAASAIPVELDCIANARRIAAQGVFLVSRGDRVSPPPFQRAVIDAFAGPRQVLEIAGGHDERALQPDDEIAYRALVRRCVRPSTGSVSSAG